MRIDDIPDIEKLSTPEKILLVADLWDNIAINEATVPTPHSHINELDKRLSHYKSNPGNILSFNELQRRIELRK